MPCHDFAGATAVLILHDYWRSGAGYRIRIALGLKAISFDRVTHDLRRGEQRTAGYRSLAPHGLVPAVEACGQLLTQSLALLEWIEERWPEPALLPVEVEARAIVRSMAALIACDVHPLNNLRVLTVLREDQGASETQISGWITRWVCDGLAALERQAQRYSDGFVFADRPTFADCCLVPQLYSAERFGVDLSPFPILVAVRNNMEKIAAVASAHPSCQSDADKE